MGEGWTITDDPVELPRAGGFRRYRYELAKEKVRRVLYAEISFGAVAAAASLTQEQRDAIASRGRSIIETHLNREAPPHRITIDTRGVEVSFRADSRGGLSAG